METERRRRRNKQAYHKVYRQEHAEELKAYHRLRRTALYGPPATEKQQAECIADPRKSLESRLGVVTPDAVFCMLCWNRYQELPHHLSCCGNLPTEWRGAAHVDARYREKFGELRKSVASEHGLGGYAKADPNRGDLLARIRPDNSGKNHNIEASLNKAERQRGLADVGRQKVSDGSILRCWLVERRTVEATAEKLGVSKGAVRRRLRHVLGVNVRRVGHFSGGQVVTGRWLTDALRRLHVKSNEIEAWTGCSASYSVMPQNLGKAIRSQVAKRLLAAEQQLVNRFLCYPEHPRAALLRAALPDWERLLQEVSAAWHLRDLARTSEQKLLLVAFDRLASAARKESARGDASLLDSRRRLCWFAEFSQPTFVRAANAVDFFALKYSVPAAWVRERPATNDATIAEETQRAIMVGLLHHPPARRGQPSGTEEETRRRIRVAAAFSRAGFGQTEMAAFAFSDKPRSALSNIQNLFREYRKEGIGRRLGDNGHTAGAAA